MNKFYSSQFYLRTQSGTSESGAQNHSAHQIENISSSSSSSSSISITIIIIIIIIIHLFNVTKVKHTI